MHLKTCRVFLLLPVIWEDFFLLLLFLQTLATADEEAVQPKWRRWTWLRQRCSLVKERNPIFLLHRRVHLFPKLKWVDSAAGCLIIHKGRKWSEWKKRQKRNNRVSPLSEVGRRNTPPPSFYLKSFRTDVLMSLFRLDPSSSFPAVFMYKRGNHVLL